MALNLYKIRIFTPPEWEAISLIDKNGKEQLGHTIINHRPNELYIRLKEPHLKSRGYKCKLYGPNYISNLEAPDSFFLLISGKLGDLFTQAVELLKQLREFWEN